MPTFHVPVTEFDRQVTVTILQDASSGGLVARHSGWGSHGGEDRPPISERAAREIVAAFDAWHAEHD